MANSPLKVTLQAARSRTQRELLKFYQNPISRVSMELLLTTLAVICLAFFAISPTLTTMSQLLKDIEDRKKTDEALTKKIQALSTVSSDILTQQKNIVLLDSTIPNAPDTSGLLRRIEYLAARTPNIILVSAHIDALPPEQQTQGAKKDLVSLQVTLNIQGSYRDVTQFLSTITAMDRLVTIDNLSLTTNKEKTSEQQQNNPLQLRALFTASYYGEKPPQEEK